MPTTTLTVRYFAAARAAAGVESDKVQVDAAATVDDLLAAIRAQHGSELDRVLQRCSFLLDEVAVRDPATPLPPVLPRTPRCCVRRRRDASDVTLRRANGTRCRGSCATRRRAS